MLTKFKASVVIPVYNVEEYLKESVDSIINQTLGFEENIQLILVNDGSKDGSEKICLEYRDQYPNNVVYVKQENAGVSVARNTGIEYVQGEFVSFLDSDDLWERSSFEKAYSFFSENTEVDVVAGRIDFFEAKTGDHMLNYRVKAGKRVADLTREEEYESVVVQVTSSFFRTSAIRDVRFKAGMKFGEDAVFVNTIVLKKLLIGFDPEIQHYYRKRDAGSSAVQSQRYKPEYFIEILDEYHNLLMDMSVERYGQVVPYIQNVVYYDLAWRFRLKLDETLDEKQKAIHFEKTRDILSKVNDKIIIRNQVHNRFAYKATAYKIKYGKELVDDICYSSELGLYVGNNVVADVQKTHKLCKINTIKAKDDSLVIEGTISHWLLELSKLSPLFVVKIDERVFYPERWENDSVTVGTPEGQVPFQDYFRILIPLKIFEKDTKKNLKFGIIFDGDFCGMGISYDESIPYWKKEQVEGGYFITGKLACLPKGKHIVVKCPKNILLEKIVREVKENRKQKGK